MKILRTTLLITLLVLTQHANAIMVFPGASYANIGGRSAPGSAWSFTTTGEQAILKGSLSLDGSNYIHGDLDFLLGETVNYCFESLSLAALNEGGSLFTEISLGDPGLGLPPFAPPVYRENVTAASPLAAIYLSGSGTLDPGHYFFHYLSRLEDGIAALGFNFTMSRVPDAGSTLLLLSFALGVIGVYRHKAS